MATQAKLVKISETEYGCSLCNEKMVMVKPNALTRAEWELRMGQHLAEHVRLRHSA